MTGPLDPKLVNMMDQPGTKEASGLKAATRTDMGYIVREEPANAVAKYSAAINAGEIMARDIGRYVKFVERFGQGRESVRVIIGELRQIYFTAASITLSVGVGDPVEYSFDPKDIIVVYGDNVDEVPMTVEEKMLDERNHRDELP